MKIYFIGISINIFILFRLSYKTTQIDSYIFNCLKIIIYGVIYPNDGVFLTDELSNSKNQASFKATQSIFKLNNIIQ